MTIILADVSIPNRDFDELQSNSGLGDFVADAFQSLIGILMNCNFEYNNQTSLSRCVSIPNRDFDELQFALLLAQCHSCKVSIPNRDFDELQ